MGAEQDRGLLDISVELSMRDIMAGNNFALFVLVKNPFTKPIYIRRVHINLPSELKLAQSEEIKEETRRIEEYRKVFEKRDSEAKKLLIEKIASLIKEVANLNNKLERKNINQDDIKSRIQSLLFEIKELQSKIKEGSGSEATVRVDQGKFKKIKLASTRSMIDLGFESTVDELEIVEPMDPPFRMQARTRSVELESSLPPNAALQPGNTVVNTVILNVKNTLLFRPSQYRLQFNVNYSFKPFVKEDDKMEAPLSDLDDLFINTFAYTISIRASLYSIILGAAIGGTIGGIARLLQVAKVTTLQTASLASLTLNLTTIAVAVILSIMAIIFTARKSEAQSFVSVEDFWGGILVGFLVGYSGTAFFESLTGITRPTS